MDSVPAILNLRRVRIQLEGVLQGVGFRPFVAGLARSLGLTGWVRNRGSGVECEIEGRPESVSEFLSEFPKKKPKISVIRRQSMQETSALGENEFRILGSVHAVGSELPDFLADLALCKSCLGEMRDPKNRRYQHPFISCTHCGPRYSVLEDLPYDRETTSMKEFPLCDRCESEYLDPNDRRYHAQTLSCWDCGPRVTLCNAKGEVIAEDLNSIKIAAQSIRNGEVIALKGIGGFHLIADARNESAISLLRNGKKRKTKPFALLVPSLDVAKSLCEVSDVEAQALTSAAAPIVLLQRKKNDLPESIAPGLSTLGLMLPYSPLHQLLVDYLGSATEVLVITSGNGADDPLCVELAEALIQMGGIAKLFINHDRCILKRSDDSIVRVIENTRVTFRLGRGLGPLSLPYDQVNSPIIAGGGHQKNTICLGNEGKMVLFNHGGDLNTSRAREEFDQNLNLSPGFMGKALSQCQFAFDPHPDYYSSSRILGMSRESKFEPIAIQHHRAHIWSCLAEHAIEDSSVLGVAWDGTGLGEDGTVWGGEFFLKKGQNLERFARLRPFHLLGGGAAIREPRRCALALAMPAPLGREKLTKQLKEMFSFQELAKLLQIEERSHLSPLTSSVGRLFDGVAGLIGLRSVADYEGQAAMELEALARIKGLPSYPFEFQKIGALYELDWRLMIRALFAELDADQSKEVMASQFHETLSQMILKVAKVAQQKVVALSGGCFQNRVLLERTIELLRENEFVPIWNQKVPPNDGGISVGQVYGGCHVPIRSG